MLSVQVGTFRDTILLLHDNRLTILMNREKELISMFYNFLEIRKVLNNKRIGKWPLDHLFIEGYLLAIRTCLKPTSKAEREASSAS